MFSKIKFKELKKIIYDKNSNYFLIENPKVILEIIEKNKSIIENIFIDKNNQELINLITTKFNNTIIVDKKEIEKLSNLKTNRDIVAIIKKEENKKLILENINLIFDNIQDPGNLGTIIRTADWFGVKNIICSNNSVDVYNHKCIQASMGSIFNVNVFYKDLNELLKENIKIKSYATVLNATPLKEINFNINEKIFLIFGNESNGISNSLLEKINYKITIENINKIDSLNVAIANAIILHHILIK